MQKRHLRIYSIASGKGGVGKTTLSVNLAMLLCSLGRRVTLLDGDFGMGNVCISMGLDPKVTLEDVFFSGSTLEDIVLEPAQGLRILPGTSGAHAMESLCAKAVGAFFDALLEFCLEDDYLLIDSSAGIGRHVRTFMAMADEIVLVTTPEPTAMADAYGLAKSLFEIRPDANLALVVNRCNSSLEAKGVENKMKVALKKFLNQSLRYLGFVPAEKMVMDCSRIQEIYTQKYKNTPVYEKMVQLARVLDGKDLSRNSVEKIMDMLQ